MRWFWALFRSKPPQNKTGFDFRAILDSSVRPFMAWLLLVIGATLAGFPGVICITPIAWLLALAAGVRVDARSASNDPRQRIVEAGLAGTVLGILQAVLFMIIAPRLGPIQPDEQAAALGIQLALLCVGVPGAAGLAMFTAWMAERRQGNL